MACEQFCEWGMVAGENTVQRDLAQRDVMALLHSPHYNTPASTRTNGAVLGLPTCLQGNRYCVERGLPGWAKVIWIVI